jgi:predicted RNase H-like HicB family nuclease
VDYTVDVVIEEDEDGFYAFCPALDGCQSQGDTFEEALRNITEAAELYLETLSPEEIARALRVRVITTSLQVAIA